MNENRTEIEYEIQFHSDGSYSIVAKPVSDMSVLEAALKVEEMKKLVGLSDCIHKIQSVTPRMDFLFFRRSMEYLMKFVLQLALQLHIRMDSLKMQSA